ncbi:hypothetical protein [Nitrobacter winogradskyi]|uniref:Uncharacterized protein n=1 Tax=Nitrobacter winogradskyi TaxID=913 RepID=A0ACC6AMQ7_NITWI|nr:hypothetical protein [Nitrobacter winogradskyi]
MKSAPANERDDKAPEPNDPNRAGIRIDLSGIGGASTKQ